ncbi:hypothetical protein BDZ89DRAFT_1130017 [Hymenopellis radicata]|nr:hypothetical protein BDZ89DRAFT_1130017 [Hymenopellis radicata]
MSANFQATAGELALVSRILAQGDPTKSGHLAGDVAVRIFGGAKLQPTVLGEIWSMADEDNQGRLSSKGVAVAVRLMGWAQKGEKMVPALISKPGPLPTIDGVSDVGRQNTGMSLPRSPPPMSGLPPLTAQDKAKFQNMFQKTGPSNGLLSGEQARDIFVKSKLSNEKLGQIWTLADTHDRGSLDATDFTIAMYLIQGAMSGQIHSIPPTLPPGLYQQASGIGGPISSVMTHSTGNSGSYSPVGSTFSQNRVQPQYTGQMLQPNMTGSMSGRRGAPVPPHLPARPNVSHVGSSAFGKPAPVPWDITATEKTESDGFFDTLDNQRNGYIEGDVAVPFMLESNLPGEDLAQVWDLADINNDGRLTKDGFAVAMYLIKKKLAGGTIPATLPPSLVPPSMRKINGAVSAFHPPAPAPPAPQVSDSLADLLWDDPPPAAAPPVAPQSTGFTSPAPAPALSSAFGSSAPTRSVSSPAPPPRPAAQDPFGSSPFDAGQDLMGDDDEVTPSPPLQDQSAEIGNTQNQLNSTNRSLQTTKAERETTEQTLANQAAQLSSLQTQLSFAKAAYETETKLLAALHERFSSQTAEIQKSREFIISAESDLSALRVEKAEVEGSLLRDKEEVRDLHRKMTEFGQQAESLKAETEKLKKEAKQQRGLLAIARKQLSTKEAEKAKAEKELQEAAAEAATVTQEKTQVDNEIAEVEKSLSTLSSPSPSVFSPAPERALSSDSLAFAASQALPATPDPSSPGGGAKSNNPFERLAMSSGQSTPTRTGSPFLPFAGTSVPTLSNVSAPPPADPFGFDQVFASEPPNSEVAVSHAKEIAVTPKISPTQISASPPPPAQVISPSETEDFRTPPSTSSGFPDRAPTPPRTTTLDAVSSKFPALDDAAAAISPTQNVPGHFQEPSEHTDLTAQLKEIELEESDSSDDEDEMPLAELAKSKSNGSAFHSPSPEVESKPATSFDDIFGVGSEPSNEAAPVASSQSVSASGSPFHSSPSPFTSTDAFGAPALSEAKAQPMAGVNAFDEAMGMLPGSTPSATAPNFSFDSAFDDNFDFGSSGASTSEPAFPQPPKANGAVSPLGAKDDGFDSLFTQPATNGNHVAPVTEPQPSTTPVAIPQTDAPAPAPSTSGPSFDEVFSGFDATPAPDLSASLSSAPPPQAPESMAPAPFPTTAASPPKSVSSVQTNNSRPLSPTRERSPPPRVSSPTPRPRPSTSSSKDGDKSKEPTVRHSKLSIRLPFGKKKKTMEAPPPPPSQFLTPPAEEPRTASPAVDDDVEPVKQITAMGFSRHQAVEALEKYAYDVPRALNSLLGQ